MLASANLFLLLSAISGFLSVAFGAFGAHALKASLDEYHLKVFHTGVDYQFYHTFALALVGLLLLRGDQPLLRASGYSFLVGTVIFSGSLYLLALTRVGKWGAVTPIGGLAFLVGWVLLAVAACRIVKVDG